MNTREMCDKRILHEIRHVVNYIDSFFTRVLKLITQLFSYKLHQKYLLFLKGSC